MSKINVRATRDMYIGLLELALIELDCKFSMVAERETARNPSWDQIWMDVDHERFKTSDGCQLSSESHDIGGLYQVMNMFRVADNSSVGYVGGSEGLWEDHTLLRTGHVMLISYHDDDDRHSSIVGKNAEPCSITIVGPNKKVCPDRITYSYRNGVEDSVETVQYTVKQLAECRAWQHAFEIDLRNPDRFYDPLSNDKRPHSVAVVDDIVAMNLLLDLELGLRPEVAKDVQRLNSCLTGEYLSVGGRG